MSTSVPIQLGDVVGIVAPTNSDLNQQYFLVEYLSQDRLVLRGNDGEDHVLRMTNGELSDQSITRVEVVNSADDAGYAKQHDLIPGTWVNIQFGGDVPMIVVGEIVGLDEDMINVKTWPGNEHIYIDFAYQGIPQQLDIVDIATRAAPEGSQAIQPKVDIELPGTPDSDSPKAVDEAPTSLLEQDVEVLGTPEPEEDVDIVLAPVDITEEIASADAVVYGAELGSVTQAVEVADHRRRYPIEAQLNDMLDDILASVPSKQRTSRRLAEIQTMLERYKQLRSDFSVFDEFGTPRQALVRGAQHRPLTDALRQLENVPSWVFPVTKNVKKVYDVEGEPPYGDVVVLSLQQQLDAEAAVLAAYKSSNTDADRDNALTRFMNQTEPFGVPYDTVPRAEAMADIPCFNPVTSIVDNLGDEESSVFQDGCCLEKYRFLLQMHNSGQTALVPTPHVPGASPVKRAVVVPPETASVTGLITFPANVAATTINQRPGALISETMDAADVTGGLQSLLVRGAPVETNTVTEFDTESRVITTPNELTLHNLDDPLYADEDRWTKFLTSVVPPTRALISLMGPYSGRRLDYLTLVQILSPFAVTPDDITYRQYNLLSDMLHKNVMDYRQRLGQKRNAYDRFARIANSAFARYREPFRLPHGLLQEYGIAPKTLPLQIISEALRLDGASAFISAIGTSATHGFQPPPNQIATTAIQQLEQKRSPLGPCSTRVVAAVYTSIEELNATNGVTAFFSSERDTTDYSLLSKIPATVTSPDDQLLALVTLLEQTDNVNEEQAAREAQSILDKRRAVADGEFAILTDGVNPVTYYKRQDNTWVESPGTQPVDFIPDEKLFCLEEQDCNYMKRCMDEEQAETSVELDALKAATKGFELERGIVEDDAARRRADRENAARALLPMLQRIRALPAETLRMARARLAAGVELPIDSESPYASLFAAILGQNDFPKKQNDIIRFSTTYTVPGKNEWMRDCVTTKLPLLPTFFVDLAQAFTRGDYQKELDQVCRVRGVLSDSGDTWVDKHSGYLIRTMEFDTSEGYDESGYQIISHDLIQQDIAEQVLQKEYTDEETGAIAKVVTGFCNQIGVNIDGHMDFITNETRTMLRDLLPDKAAYARRIKAAQHKGRSVVSYETAYNSVMLYLAICLTLVAVQTAIPSVRASRSFPGCKRSFSGAPFGDASDQSGLQYFACVTTKMKSAIPPWDTIRRMKEEAVFKKLESIMTRVAKSRTVVARIGAKREFLETNPEDIVNVAPEYDVRQWSSFLPPLATPNVEPVRQLPDSFFQTLSSHIAAGKSESIEGLALIINRTMHLSFGIQEAIQGVVNEHPAILRTVQGVPFIENACCNEGRDSSVGFFSGASPAIAAYNRHAKDNMDRFYALYRLASAPSYYDPRNTRTDFLPVSKDASRTVIYQVMLYYCQYNKPTFVGDALTALCGHRSGPSIEGLGPEDIVSTLNSAGIEYNIQDLMRLSQFNAVQNRLSIQLRGMPAPGDRLRRALELVPDNGVVNAEVLSALAELFDMYGVRLADAGKHADRLRNSIIASSETMTENIRDFLRRSGVKLSKQSQQFLDELHEWVEQPPTTLVNAKDATASRLRSFAGDAVLAVGRTFPSVIAHEVRYSDVPIPKHWKLSQRHVSDIKAFIAKEYAPIAPFYGNAGVTQVCETVLSRSSVILSLQELTPLLPARKDAESVFNARVATELSVFYILSTLTLYIQATMELSERAVPPTVGVELRVPVELGSDAEDTGAAADAISSVLAEQLNPLELQKQTGALLGAMIGMLSESKRIENVGIGGVKEKTLKAREKEKDEITSYLRDLSDEEREAQDVLKNNRLGAWGKGHTRGLVHYVQDVYDDEVAALEQRAAIENRLGEQSEVTDMNRDIYALVAQDDALTAQGIQDEVDNISELPNDDDYGDQDGDEGF